jgi:hypothetical protein
MSPALNRLGRSTNFLDLLYALDPLPHALFVLTIQPLRIVATQVHWTLEYPGPLKMCGIKVRVADNDSFDTAVVVYKGDGSRIDKGNNIPEDISLGCLD